MTTIKIAGYTFEEEKQIIAVKIEMWYDRHLRLWTMYPVDAEGNQIAAAVYEAHKNDALDTKAALETEYNI